MAAVLSRAWRNPCPDLDIPDDQLVRSLPLLISRGAGAVAWWRIRQSARRSVRRSYRKLHAVYRNYALEAVIHEMETVKLFRRMRAFNVEPILLKGWAAARAYPEPGLRPCGDIDLWVAPDQHIKAEAALATREPSPYAADLHHDIIERFSESSFEQIYGRSQTISVRGIEIRIPSPEDHLRILCLHMLKHGVSRPFWLMDIAVALESRPASFDWDLCLGRDKRHRQWILCAIALVSRLLGAIAAETPADEIARELPGRLCNRVLKQWKARPQSVPSKFVDELRSLGWNREILKAIRLRWPNPLQATIDEGGSLDAVSTLPYQLRNCIRRGAKLARSVGVLSF